MTRRNIAQWAAMATVMAAGLWCWRASADWRLNAMSALANRNAAERSARGLYLTPAAHRDYPHGLPARTELATFAVG